MTLASQHVLARCGTGQNWQMCLQLLEQKQHCSCQGCQGYSGAAGSPVLNCMCQQEKYPFTGSKTTWKISGGEYRQQISASIKLSVRMLLGLDYWKRALGESTWKWWLTPLVALVFFSWEEKCDSMKGCWQLSLHPVLSLWRGRKQETSVRGLSIKYRATVQNVIHFISKFHLHSLRFVRKYASSCRGKSATSWCCWGSVEENQAGAICTEYVPKYFMMLATKLCLSDNIFNHKEMSKFAVNNYK